MEESLKVAQEDLLEKEAARDEVIEEMNDCRVKLDRKHKSIADVSRFKDLEKLTRFLG